MGNKIVLRKPGSGCKMADTSKQIFEYIKRPEVLQSWAHLTLRERTIVIKDEFGHTVDPS